MVFKHSSMMIAGLELVPLSTALCYLAITIIDDIHRISFKGDWY